MQQPTAVQCPQCGAPPSPGRAILVCEYCGASMMMAPPGYGGGGPVAPFGAPGALPPAYYQGRRRGNPAVAIIFAVVAVFGVAGASMAVMLGTRSHATPTPPPDPNPIVVHGGGGGGAGPTPVTTPTAMFETKCQEGDAQSCVVLGTMYQHGSGVAVDQEKAKMYYARACTLGDQSGCTLKDMGPDGMPAGVRKKR